MQQQLTSTSRSEETTRGGKILTVEDSIKNALLQ